MDINGARALVTGATGGIGHAIARALHARGASLILTGRRAEILEPLAAETGGTAIACDLADRADVARLVEEAGDVDVLVANAALPASGLLLEYAVEEIDRAAEVNFRAPIVLARQLAPGMATRRRGHVVIISSLSGKSAARGSALYSATKWGVRGFALGLRDELHEHGVGVSTVFPGFIRDAGMFADSGALLPRGVGTRSPEEVAAAVVKAIESNRAEIDVAPFGLRAGAKVFGLAPGVALALQRRMGGSQIADAIADGQRAKR